MSLHLDIGSDLSIYTLKASLRPAPGPGRAGASFLGLLLGVVWSAPLKSGSGHWPLTVSRARAQGGPGRTQCLDAVFRQKPHDQGPDAPDHLPGQHTPLEHDLIFHFTETGLFIRSALDSLALYRITALPKKECFVLFSSVAQSCPTLCDPMNRSMPGLPVHHHLPEFTQTHGHQVSDTCNHLILCRPLLLLPQSLPASGSFLRSQFFA